MLFDSGTGWHIIGQVIEIISAGRIIPPDRRSVASRRVVFAT
jgi:hypothetical protein